jgi:hypothetical protein
MNNKEESKVKKRKEEKRKTIEKKCVLLGCNTALYIKIN